MALTKRQVDALRWNPKGQPQQVLYDSELAGFGVRVYASGRKSFVIRYRTTKGRQRWHTLGAYGVLTVQQAHTRAVAVLAKVGQGGDPQDERQEARQGVSLRDFSTIYLQKHAKPHKRSWAEDVRRLNTYLLPKLGPRRLEDIKRAHIQSLHATIGAKHRHEANRVLALAGVIFSKARDWGYLPEDAVNPASRVEQFAEQSRDEWVKPAELPALLASIDMEPNPFHRAAFRLYLYTGLRRSELLSLEWVCVNLEDQPSIYLRQTKANRPHRLPLPPEAATILRELPRTRGAKWVFPASSGEGHAVDLKKPWRRIRERAGMEHVRLHDLRRTVGSMMVTQGASISLIAKVLNHSELKTTEVYARLTDDSVRDAVNHQGRTVAAAIERSKVIDLAAERARRVAGA